MSTVGTYCYDYPRPIVTADTVVFAYRNGQLHLLLIQRGKDPFKGQWALPGGFMELEEELIDAAARELAEETGLTGCELKQLGAFGRVGRDPRGRTISAVYTTLISAEKAATIKAGDDAALARWFDVADLPPLAFDHREIVDEALKRRAAEAI